jgi:hypothetical protein
MSNDVTIVDFGQNVPQWATEKTLDDIRNIFHKSYGLDKERTDTLDNVFDEMQKTRTITDRYLKSINKALKGGDVDRTFERTKKAEINSVREATNATGSFNRGILTAGTGMQGFHKHVGLAGAALAAFKSTALVAIYPLQRIIRNIIGNVRDTVGAFGEYHKVGIVYNKGVLEHVESLAKLGMTHKDMTEIVQKHARTISLVSVPAFMSLGNTLNNQRENLYQLGLTTKDATKFMAEHFEKQRLMGIFEFQDAQSMSGAVMDTMKSLTAYTRIMNRSREEIIESQRQMLGRADIQRMIASMEPEAAKGMRRSWDTLSGVLGALPEKEGANIREWMADMVASPIITASKSFIQLSGDGQVEMATMIADMAQRVQTGQVSVKDSLTFLDRIAESTRASSQSGLQNSLALAQDYREMANAVGGELGFVAKEASTRLRGLLGNMDLLSEEEIMARLTTISAEGKAVTAARDRVDKISADIDYAQIQKTFQILGVESKELADNINKLNDGLDMIHGKVKSLIEYTMPSFQDAWGKYLLGAGAGLLGLAGVVSVLKGAFGSFTRMILGTVGLGGLASAGPAAASGGMRGFGLGMIGAGVGHGAASLLGRDTRAGGLSAAAGTAAGFAGTGAMLGKFLGPYGPLIGAAAGGVIGGGVGLYQNRDAIFRSGKVSQEGEQARRVQRPEQISQTEAEAMINSVEGGDLAPLLKSIASASYAQLEKTNELVRLVRSGQTGITGQQFS